MWVFSFAFLGEQAVKAWQGKPTGWIVSTSRSRLGSDISIHSVGRCNLVRYLQNRQRK